MAFSYARLKTRIVSLLLAAVAVSGEPLKNSPHDAIRTSDLVVVGDTVAGNAVNVGNFVDCTLTVHPLRILHSKPGFGSRDIQVHWQYRPRFDRVVKETMPVDRIHAIWFLKERVSDDGYEAMWVDISSGPMGGYFEPIPEGKPSGTYSYSPDATLDRKLAGELGVAMETIARAAGASLNVTYRADTSPYNGVVFTGPPPAGYQQRVQFQSLASLYKELNPADIREVNSNLIGQPQIHLKAVGLIGELRAKSVNALLMMEKFYTELVVTGDPMGLSFWAESIDIAGNDAAIRAVGRMCVSNAHLAGFDQFAVGQMARAKSPAAVPYLAVMLEHSDDKVRSSAAEGICGAIAADVDLKGLADSTFVRACSYTTIVTNRVGAHHDPRFRPWLEKPDVDLLKEWIRAHPSVIREVVAPQP
jgi:hypothetical protein